jgi:hypothetical protein
MGAAIEHPAEVAPTGIIRNALQSLRSDGPQIQR